MAAWIGAAADREEDAKRPAAALRLAALALSWSSRPDTWLLRIRIHCDAKRYLEAVREGEKALAHHPHDSDLRHALHVSLAQRGLELAAANRLDDAIQRLVEALRIADDENLRKLLSGVFISRASARYERGDQYGAHHDLEQALDWDPDNDELRHVLYGGG